MDSPLVLIVSGRIAVSLLAISVVLPYFVRRRKTIPTKARDATRSYVVRLQPHFWLGYFIVALSTIHAGVSGKAMAHANSFGIWAATIALLLLVCEIAIGLNLRDVPSSGRASLKKVHFRVMVAGIALLAVHLWLNAK